MKPAFFRSSFEPLAIRLTGLTVITLFAIVLTFRSTSGIAAPGDVTDNSGLIPFEQAYFAFEVEGPLETLKEVPSWDELEQMLDDPYQFAYEPGLPRNEQGYPSYRSTQERRRSFVFRNSADEPCAPLSPDCSEVSLPRFLVHPLNYNHMNGEEMRLLNIEFEGADWTVPDQLLLADPGDPNATPPIPPRYEWTYRPIFVSPGLDRVEEDEAAPDFNSPIKPDVIATIVTTEATTVPEGSLITGGDPGEPGYAGFGTLRGMFRRGEQYSTPALPLNSFPFAERVVGLDITSGSVPLGQGNKRLFDPARGYINPRNPVTGVGGLRKPSLRTAEVGGTGWLPNYLANSEAELIAREADAAADEGVPSDPDNAAALLLPSNENDYIKGITREQKVAARTVAAALGKALFWDMQVGSDSVQACASCHFHAGADDRTKNQLNPNHLGGDLTLQLHGGVANQELTAVDFPFHKLTDVTIPGEPLLNPGNVVSDTNDVASSMGVIFGTFADIPSPGGGPNNAAAFVQGQRPRSLMPDLRDNTIDPIPVFQGLRRVEPRNTPTLFASTMNFDNFWDGRARHDFNGGSVFGPSDPQAHVMVDDGAGSLVATRQIIRFSSLASLATGPGLSEFEMSFMGRNWAKIGKKLLQQGVTPLANQLVDPMDSVLGPYSNQPGNPNPDCGPATIATRAPGRPGLCRDYRYLIRQAFYPALWRNTTMHLEGGAVAPVAIPVLQDGNVVEVGSDPFDGYSLAIAAGPANPTNTSQFTQMEANMPLFFGLAVQTWGQMLIPDDTPSDRFLDANPNAFKSFGEANEPGLVLDLLVCGQVNQLTGEVAGQPCLTEVGNFKRDPDVMAGYIGATGEANPGVSTPAGGTRQPGTPDPLLGMDFFLGSNLSLKNPNYRTLRCGECHAGGTLTDHTFEISHQVTFGDFVQEFGTPGQEAFPEPLGRSRVITGFSLEGELQENAQDGIERNIADQCANEPCVDAHGNPIPGGVLGGYPQGQALFDNGVYNLGVTPIANDVSRGGTDAFGWPLSLAYLALKNLGGPDYSPGGDDPLDGFAQPPYPGIPLSNFDPAIDPTGGGLFEPSAQDQQINPGFGEEPAEPMLPPYLAPWASNIPVGDETNQDEVFFGLNTLCAEPILEGFVDAFGPFNPAATIGENFNNARQPEMATWPNVNRVNTQGGFKAPPLRNIALTGPYFHNGGKLTLRQQLDFYLRGGDFPKTNAAHRDFLLINLMEEDEALGGVDPVSGESMFTADQKEEIIVAVIDFLLELTDERVAYERAPFDHPEIFVPLDGAAPDNTFGRPGFLARLANGMYRQVPASGMGGNAAPLQNFLGVTNNPAADCVTEISHYCH